MRARSDPPVSDLKSMASLRAAIRDRAYAYQRSVHWEREKPPTAIIDALVVELGPAEVLALAEDKLHCDV